MIKEKDIVNKLIANWSTYFPDLNKARKEYVLRDSRVDILSSFNANLKDLGVREEDYFCSPAVFFEVKYNSNMRDLLFELQKLVKFRDWYINIGKAFCMICVISDDYDEYMVDFMLDNQISMFQLSIENDDIATLKVEEYIPFSHKEIDINIEANKGVNDVEKSGILYS